MPSPLNPATAAIAAVLACSTFPAMAQMSDPAAAPPVVQGISDAAPAIAAPPVAATTPNVDPATETATTAPAASPNIVFKPATPVVQQLPAQAEAASEANDAPAPAAAPAPRAAASRAETRAVAPTSASFSNSAAANAESARTAPPAPALPQPIAAPATPVEASGAAMSADSQSTPEPAAQRAAENGNDMLWLGGGALLLLLGGAGLVAIRRKATPVYSAAPERMEPVIPPAVPIRNPAAPAFAADMAPAVIEKEPLAPKPALANSPAATARVAEDSAQPYGQQRLSPVKAGKGDPQLEAMIAAAPSPENPFLTRRNRLRRASFVIEHGHMASGMPRAADPVAQTAMAERTRVEHAASETPAPAPSQVQLSYSFGRPERPSPKLKPRLSRS